MAWAEEAVHGFKELLDRVQALIGDSLSSKLDTLIARVRWYFSENEVKFLRSSLSVARESMRGFSNIRVIEKLDEQMRLLKAAIAKGSQRTIEDQLGVDLEERIRMLVQKKSVVLSCTMSGIC
jgi:23S rRNA A2030 N6-methylase RlmJ